MKNLQKTKSSLTQTKGSPSPAHFMFSTDLNWAKYLLVVWNSMIENTPVDKRGRLFFHVLVDSESTRQQIEKYLTNTLLKNKNPDLITFQYEIKIPEAVALEKLEKNIFCQFQRISNVMNFARFLFPDTFPEVDKCVYVDIDMVFQHNPLKLARLPLNPKKPLLALKDKKFQDGIRLEYLQQKNYRPSYRGFNAGLFVTDLNYWRQHQLLEQVEQLMLENKKHPEGYFRFGTQPLMNLMFYEKYEPLPSRWQLKDLGWNPKIKKKKIREAFLLHWNGSYKGWYADGYYQKWWDRWQPVDDLRQRKRKPRMDIVENSVRFNEKK